MASEIVRASSGDTSDLQAQYAKKKRELVNENEQELRGIESKYRAETSEETQSGKAAVNHIREKNAAELSALRDSNQKNQSEILKQNAESIAKERDYGSEVRAGYAEKKREIRAQNEDEIRNIETGYKRSVSEEVKVGKAGLTRAHDVQAKEIEEIHRLGQETHQELLKENEENALKEREFGQKLVNSTTDKYRREYQKQKELGETRVEETKKLSAEQIKNAREQSVQREDRLRAQYTQEINETTKLGETRKAAVLGQDKAELNHEKLEHEQKLDTENKQFTAKRDEQSKLHAATLENQKELQGKLRVDQKQKFDSTYQKTALSNQAAFAQLRKLDSQAGEKLKADFALKSAGTLEKSEDSFYKVEPSRARLEETTDSYIVRLPVPEHERDHVQVRVENGKASVTGTRAFQEKISEADRKLSSSSYQTYREEFALDKPIRATGVERRDLPGLIEVHIPKIHV